MFATLLRPITTHVTVHHTTHTINHAHKITHPGAAAHRTSTAVQLLPWHSCDVLVLPALQLPPNAANCKLCAPLAEAPTGTRELLHVISCMHGTNKGQNQMRDMLSIFRQDNRHVMAACTSHPSSTLFAHAHCKHSVTVTHRSRQLPQARYSQVVMLQESGPGYTHALKRPAPLP